MFKLVKYELRKQLFSKIIILVLLGLLEIGFLVGLFTESERTLGISIGLFIFLTIATVLFISFESIFTFSNDLKTKQSYMLFLTPNSTYKIVGAKVITTALTVLLTTAAFLSITMLDVAAVFTRYGTLADLVEEIQNFIARMTHANINYAYIIALVCYIVFDIIRILVVGMSSITLSATFLANSRGKGVVSVAFFFGINFLFSRLASLVLPARSLTSTDPYYINCVWTLGIVVIFYFLTSYMLDKKVSV